MKTYLQLNAQKDSLSGPLAFRMVVIRFLCVSFVCFIIFYTGTEFQGLNSFSNIVHTFVSLRTITPNTF